PGRTGRQRPPLPDQRDVREVLPVRRRCRHGQPRPGGTGGMLVKIRPMQTADAGAVLRIYQAGMDSGNASFETWAPDWATFDAGKLPEHRYVAVDDADAVLGWVTVSAVS